MKKLKYRIPYECEESFYDFNSCHSWPEYIAEEAAAEHYNHHDGWESGWPLGVEIFDGDRSLGHFTVELNHDPTFSATKTESDKGAKMKKQLAIIAIVGCLMVGGCGERTGQHYTKAKWSYFSEKDIWAYRHQVIENIKHDEDVCVAIFDTYTEAMVEANRLNEEREAKVGSPKVKSKAVRGYLDTRDDVTARLEQYIYDRSGQFPDGGDVKAISAWAESRDKATRAFYDNLSFSHDALPLENDRLNGKGEQ